MNPFSVNNKNPETRIPQRTKIKSKYFGQYEPQVFIASRSKSKSRSTSKDDINNLITKKSPLNSQPIKIDSQQRSYKAQTITINPQTTRSPRSFNSGSLSEYLLTRSASPRRRKQGSAIEMIVEWVERKYFEKIKNHKIDKDTSLSFLRDNKFTQSSQLQKFEESLKKFAYDAFILIRLKEAKYMKASSLGKGKKSLIIYNESPKHDSKENDIDNINISPLKQVSKVQDFDIYKFKKNPNYSTDVNLMRISQLSIEHLNRSGQKIMSNQYLPEKEQFSSGKNKFDIPTMNTLQKLDSKDGKVESVESQKDFQIGRITHQNKAFFVETARSTSTNQMMELSKNSISQNSINDKEKMINTKEISKKGPLYEGDLKISINITKDSEQVQLKQNQQLLAKNNPDLKAADNFKLTISKKVKNQTGLCELDYWRNSLFHPEKLPEIINPTQVDTMSIVQERSQQILNEIFQMSHDQQQILKTIGLNQNSQLFNSKKDQKTQNLEKSDSIINKIQPNNDSQVFKSRKSFAENYFSRHLAVNQQPNQVKTYQMPLAKANTNFKVKMTQDNQSNTQNQKKILIQNKSPNKEVFTFNSLSPQNGITKVQTTKQKASFHNKKTQTNAFVQKCNLFGLCSGESAKQLQRSNYFTQMSTSGRQRVTSANSNQSKASSKPKVSFNYISPSSKHINMLSKEKEGESSILFKSQASQLKNTGKAPVKIQIKPSRQRKENEEILESIVKEVVPSQVRDFRTESIVVEQKERSQSVPHFAVQKVVNQQVKIEPITQYQKVNTQQKVQSKNAFVTSGYGPSYYYQSQKSIPNPPPTQVTPIQPNYQSAQSYYFPGMVSPHMGNTQTLPNRVLPLGPIISSKKDKQPMTHRNDHRYLYPIQQSVEKEKTQRTKSICEKIIVTVKKNQC